MIRRGFVFLLLLAGTASAKWDIVYRSQTDPNVGNRQIPFWCGYFFDDMTGVVGGGKQNDLPVILRTTDGGTTWNLASTPFANNGYPTSIYFIDANTGYASIRSPNFPTTTLWKSTDGGISWQDITSSFNTGDEAYMCIWATSKTLIATAWYGIGGISLNDGTSWQQTFTRDDFVPGPNIDNQKSNGIYFTDDLHGVVTMGPNNPQPNGNRCFFTQDGGLTWQRSWDFIESWSVYGLKNTTTFFLAPEGDNGSNRDIMRSDDGGFSWRSVFAFPDNVDMTGHIDGRANVLYIQVQQQTGIAGLYRSDDLGASWKFVGGPSHEEDSRFCLAGCDGNIVFAFDLQGNIYKTSDGGDSTLTNNNLPVLTITPDTLLVTSTNCQPDRATIRLANYYTDTTCSKLFIDSLFFENTNEFTLDTVNKFTIGSPNYADVPVTFQTNNDTIIFGKLHIKARNNSRTIDTILTIIAKGSQAPTPYIPALTSVSAGQELRIPIFIQPTVDTFTMNSFDAAIRFNTDILSPDGYINENGNVKTATVTPTTTGAHIYGEFVSAVTESHDVTKPIISLRMKTTLSTDKTTAITLDTFSINGGTPLPLCVTPQSMFSLSDDCGDSVLSEFMRSGNIPTIMSVRPNPLTGSTLEVTINSPIEASLRLELVDMNGNTVGAHGSVPMHFVKGVHTVKLNVNSLQTGTYYIRLSDGNGFMQVKKIVEVK
jgi:photosystem II stability/assembly factor-like uncharacterized protein